MALGVASKGNERSDRQSSVQYLCVLGGRQDLCVPKACGSETTDSPTADSSAPCLPAPWTNVSNTRSHIRWNPASIRLSGSFRRPARRLACSDRDSCSGEKRWKRSTPGVGLQRRRNPGPLQCYNAGHNLRGATIHGPSLLDSRVLGSCLVGDALHHVRVPLEVLETTAKLRRHGRAVPFANLHHHNTQDAGPGEFVDGRPTGRYPSSTAGLVL